MWVLVAVLALLAVVAGTTLFAGGRHDSLGVSHAPPHNGLIAYRQWRVAPGDVRWSEIAVARPGDNPRSLLSEVGTDYTCPAFSPDGTMLAYRIGADVVARAIDGVGSPGPEHARFTLPGTTGDECARWSLDSTRLAVASGAFLTVHALSGETSRFALPSVTTEAVHVPVAWAPAGDRVAVATEAGVVLVPLDGDAPTRLPSGPVTNLSWSPDGSRIALTVEVERQDPDGETRGHAETSIVALDGSADPVTILTDALVWSPDGSKVAYSASGANACPLVMARPDGSDIRLIGTNCGYSLGPWSPDGRWVLSLLDTNGIDAALLANDASGPGLDPGTTTVIVPTTLVPSVTGLSPRGFPVGRDVTWQSVFR